MNKGFVYSILVAALVLFGIVVIFGSLRNNSTNTTGTTTPTTTTAPTTATETTTTTVTPTIAKTYTMSEVEQHNKSTDCWMVIEGKVYDVTSFIGNHPGGSVIINGCGKDATQMFNTQGGQGSHSDVAQQMKERFYIGDLAK